MVGKTSDQIDDRLILRSQLSEITRIPLWITALASRHGISERTQFSINLCLEEALSNVVQHGYRGAADRSLTVNFASPGERYFEFVVEDEAPAFNPLEAEELPALTAGAPMRIGGQGIRLIRRFADSIEYERTDGGNRLHLGFLDRG